MTLDAPTMREKREARVLAATDTRPDMLERVLIQGDLSKLSAEQRNEYYLRVCETTGLNPLTQPFSYLTLNGKLVLYANKACTDQLRAIHRISVVDMDEEERGGVFVVTVKVQNAEGRTDMGKGAVNIASLKGDALANAIMKSETKAKRRATLSICGLGMLDETEIETIPAARLSPQAHDAQQAGDGEPPPSPAPQRERVLNVATGRMVDPNSSAQLKKNGAWDSFTDKLQHFQDAHDLDGLKAWFTSEDVQVRIARWPDAWREQADEEYGRVHDELEKA